jgi:hypothetical protein
VQKLARKPVARRRRRRVVLDFVKLWLAQGVSNLGDGVYVTALPLPAATLTRCRSRRSCSPSGCPAVRATGRGVA